MNKTILICDDDLGILEVCRYILEEKGYKIHVLNNGKNIVEVINKTKPNLLILDLWMPIVSGEEVVKKLRKNKMTKKIPIIILSAHREADKIADKIGADDYLCKPFDIKDLEDLVDKFIQK